MWRKLLNPRELSVVPVMVWYKILATEYKESTRFANGLERINGSIKSFKNKKSLSLSVSELRTLKTIPGEKSKQKPRISITNISN